MIHSAMKYNVNVISERKMFRKKDMQYRILLRIFLRIMRWQRTFDFYYIRNMYFA